MKKIYLVLLAIAILASPESSFAWPGMPLPPLHVDGRDLKDDCGNKVVLHGVAITPSPWFNGCMYGFSSKYCTWDNYDVQGALRYNKAIMDKLTNTEEGWHLSYIRLHIDPYWSNTPGPPISEHDISRFDFDRFVKYTDEVIIPLINHAKERGLYVILRPPGVCPERIAVGDAYHDYLKVIWNHLSRHNKLKNTDHLMFELANEPVQILGTNGVWGTTSQAHFDALKNYFQPIVDNIRANGANNVLWIPGTGWQSHYQGYAVNPITGGNIGYAVHVYPGYWGGVRNYQAFLKGWNENVKPIADIAPIALTETDWAPEGYGAFGTATTGIEGGEGFGANLNYITKQSGNVSWNVLAPDNLVDRGDPTAGLAYNGDWEACAAPVKKWFAEYANVDKPDICELVPFGIYEIGVHQAEGIVLELGSNGTDILPAESDGSVRQQWMALQAEDNSWKFISMASKFDSTISLIGANMENGAALRLMPAPDDGSDNWLMTELETGIFEIYPKAAANQASAPVWNIANCTVDGSAYLQVNSPSENSCQEFRLKYLRAGEKEKPTLTSIKGSLLIPSVKVYPNPSKAGKFIISLPHFGIERFGVSIYTLEGQVAYKGDVSAGESILETNLAAGFYIMRIQSGNYYKVIKLGVE